MIAFRDYRKSTEENIEFSKGEICTYTKRKSPWKGFRWCVKDNGKRAWIPVDYIDFLEDFKVLVKKDYFSGELDVRTGEELNLLEKASGWFFCQKGNEKGWVPSEIFSPRKERIIKNGAKTVRKRI